ncbi:MAG: Smr/MutS family protein [Candidatus Eremiobacteraeota bacterium]|nr:Smr/MutS family protein [Candidatus Eremiobacteraeota bacterium]
MNASQLADARTLEALDFDSVRVRVVSATRTQRGRARATELFPSTDFDEVRLQQSRTKAIRGLVAARDLHVLAAVDTADLTQAAALGRILGPTELRAVADAISSAAASYNALQEAKDGSIADITAAYTSLRDLQRSLTDAIDERGVVMDCASPALARLRKGLLQAQNDARDRVSAMVRSAKYANAIQDAVVTVRDGRFVIPIKAEFSGEFPGIVHDTSSSGQTLFVEPLAALETNNRIRTLRLEEEREVQRVLEALSRNVGAQNAAIEANIEMLAEVDLLVAKANVARSMDAIAPELSDDAIVQIERGRHPLLGDRAVPQTIPLDGGTRLLVVSGPNMGGKTVALKLVGLFVVMTYCGMQIPASSGTRVGRFSLVVADVGDEQSIAANASTFSAHLERMRDIFGSATDRTLVLVDEIGGGTEPGAGAALAVAMLERLLQIGACGIVTTHATELKLFAAAWAGVANASVRFDPRTFRPTYQLDVGAPGQSLAFPLARALGIDSAVVERAEALLERRERDYESALAELSLRASQIETEREALSHERTLLARERESANRLRDTLDAERQLFADRAEARMQQGLRDFTAELQRRAAALAATKPRVTSAQSDLLSRNLEALRGDLGIRERQTQTNADDGIFRANDRVRIHSLRQDGTVVEDYGDTLLISIGAMKTVVKRSDIERRGKNAAEKREARLVRRDPQGEKEDGFDSSVSSEAAKFEAAGRSTIELDVRGKRFAEAEPIVERWIDEALLAGNTPLRLIHGKGTGLLGRGLQESLRAHPSVQSIRYGHEDEGSAGVTIIELR